MSHGTPSPHEPPSGGGQQRIGPAGTRRTRRRGAARFLPLGVAAWAVLEIWLLTVIADIAGALAVLLLLAGGVVLGSLVVRRAGRRAWQQLSVTLNAASGASASAGEVAGSGPAAGNTLTMLGGLLLILPGPVSDAAGLLCLFPPTAHLLRRAAERKLAAGGPGGLGDAVRQARSAEEQFRMRRPDGRVVQGEVVRDEDERGDT
ncbi:FxsA family membrane protein [Streptomyces sp. TR02-1]|uniref:FxsA family membrane protein n=1 Tax=Streptomyces sp. TR02-1 TaxID=3385977 RepID=UPI0039A121C8